MIVKQASLSLDSSSLDGKWKLTARLWCCDMILLNNGKFLWTFCPLAPLTPILFANIANRIFPVTHPQLPATSHQSSGVESLRGLDLRWMSHRKTPCQTMHVAGEQIVRTIWLTVWKRSLSVITWNLHTKAATAKKSERGEEMRWLKVEMDSSRKDNICQQVTATFLQLSKRPDSTQTYSLEMKKMCATCKVCCFYDTYMISMQIFFF